MSINEMKKYLDEFTEARGWSEHRTPKNLCMALTVEVGELVEIFQWMTEKQLKLIEKDEVSLQHAGEEMADVLSYLLQISSVLKIDIEEAFWEKTKKNEKKYPIAHSVNQQDSAIFEVTRDSTLVQ